MSNQEKYIIFVTFEAFLKHEIVKMINSLHRDLLAWTPIHHRSTLWYVGTFGLSASPRGIARVEWARCLDNQPIEWQESWADSHHVSCPAKNHQKFVIKNSETGSKKIGEWKWLLLERRPLRGNPARWVRGGRVKRRGGGDSNWTWNVAHGEDLELEAKKIRRLKLRLPRDFLLNRCSRRYSPFVD